MSELMEVSDTRASGPQFSSLSGHHQFRPLYGGAIESILLPIFEDVSSLRDIPDHQEVFLHHDSEASIIVELLDLEKDASESNILSHYFTDLAKHNDCQNYEIFQQSLSMPDGFMPHVTPAFSRLACTGKQMVKKYRSEQAKVDYVYIALVVVRLRNVDTDVLISLNLPLSEQRLSLLPPGSDVTAIDALFQTTEALILGDHSHSPGIVQLEIVFPEVKSFQDFLHHFRIQDWSLFL